MNMEVDCQREQYTGNYDRKYNGICCTVWSYIPASQSNLLQIDLELLARLFHD